MSNDTMDGDNQRPLAQEKEREISQSLLKSAYSEIEAQKTAISNFLRTENELKAHVERLRDSLSGKFTGTALACNIHGGFGFVSDCEVCEAVGETPAQSLQAIKAEVEEEVIERIGEIYRKSFYGNGVVQSLYKAIRNMPRKYPGENGG